MSSFIPVEFAKAGETNRFAYSPTEVTELIFAGWSAIGEGTPYEPGGLTPHLRESIEDALSEVLVAGANVTLDYDDEDGTITIASTGGGGGGLDVEAVQDAVSAMVVEGSGLSAIYDDTAGTYTITLATHTHVANDISNASSVGKSILTAGDAAAVRSAAGAAATSHTHAQSDVTNLVSDLAAKAASSHTHPSSQVTDFTEAVQDVVGALLAAGTGITVNYDDAGNVATITALGGGGSWDAETTRDTIGAALIGTGVISITVNDAGDTITIASTATQNDTDANLRARSTHTGTQTASTISDLTESVQDIVGAFLAAGTGITVTYNDAGNVATIATTITQYTDEMARDALGTALVAGSNITITPNDAGDTITIASTGGLTQEQVEDAIATMIVEGSGLSAIYDDTAGTYTITLATHTHTIANVTGLQAGLDTKQPISTLNKALDPLFLPDRRRLTVTEDTAVTAFVASDAAYDRVYTRGTGAVPAGWPIDHGPSTETHSGSGLWSTAAPTLNGVRTHRTMADRDSVAFSTYATAGQEFTVKVDGAPLSAAPFVFPTTGSQMFKMVFNGGHKNRLIEITGNFYNYAWATKKPGKLWKPAPEDGPLIGVLGDSYGSPAVYNDGGTAFRTAEVLGMYQRLGPLLGVRDLIVDAYGGTGYIADGSFADYTTRLAGSGGYTSIATFAPDVLIVHGGGGNDIYGGQLDAAIITAVTTLFQNARTLLPDAKLVFVEGFAPPGFTPGTYNPRYTTIRSGLQTPLAATGVYYVDVATTSPWISGTGNTTNNTDDTENSSIYVGGDDLHLNAAGHAYAANRLAEPLRRILRDRGALLNQLVA